MTQVHTPPVDDPVRRRVFWFYALSGFISLGYQVAWFRILVDRFGSTSLTFALVVGGFIGGLGAGALLSRRLGGWLAARTGLRDGLRLWGLVELLVAASALLTPAVELLPADLWGAFPYRLDGGIWVQTTAYQAAQVATAAVCVFVPCLWMGVTFPLLCATFRGGALTGAAAQRFPSALYAWNTLGAGAGVLACQFVLILWVGHRPAFWLLAGLNLALGAYFLVRGGASFQGCRCALPGYRLRPLRGRERSGRGRRLHVFATDNGQLTTDNRQRTNHQELNPLPRRPADPQHLP